MQVVCAGGVCEWCVRVVCASDVCEWYVRVVCSGGVCEWCMRVVCASGVCEWCVLVVCASGVSYQHANRTCLWDIRAQVHVSLICMFTTYVVLLPWQYSYTGGGGNSLPSPGLYSQLPCNARRALLHNYALFTSQ